MNKVAIIIVMIGVILSILSVVVFLGIEENSREYSGSGGVWKIEESNKGEGDLGFVVTMKGTYSHGRSAVNEEGNANLTDKDCQFVRNFTLTGSKGEDYFMPSCVIYDDTTEDGFVHIGYICKNRVTDQSECNKPDYSGLPDAGEYTWNTQDTEINVYHLDAIIFQFFGSILSCCCGSLILIIGIILAFALQEEDTSKYYQSNTQSSSSTASGAKGWDEQEDYIRKETSEDETTEKEDSEEENKKDRSGEYELPPPK